MISSRNHLAGAKWLSQLYLRQQQSYEIMTRCSVARETRGRGGGVPTFMGGVVALVFMLFVVGVPEAVQ